MYAIFRNIYMPKRAAVVLGAAVAGFFFFAGPVRALDNGLAKTPPMGWNSWNKFGCNVSETLIRQAADALVSAA